MDLKYFVVLISIGFTTAYHMGHYIDDSDEDISKGIIHDGALTDRPINTNYINRSKNKINTAKSEPRYEVTENVIDIPNNTPIPGPIVTNFSINNPINGILNDKKPNTTIVNKVNKDGFEEDQLKNLEKKYYSILQIISETNHKNPVTHEKFVNLQQLLQDIKDFLRGVKGFFRGTKNTREAKHEFDDNDYDYLSMSDFLSEPETFLNDFHSHRKGKPNKFYEHFLKK